MHTSYAYRALSEGSCRQQAKKETLSAFLFLPPQKQKTAFAVFCSSGKRYTEKARFAFVGFLTVRKPGRGQRTRERGCAKNGYLSLSL